MKNLISLLTLFILLSNSQNCKAQSLELPPVESVANDENKILIDKIIELTDYKRYFDNYCLNFVKKIGKKEKWSSQKSQNVKSRINFNEFKVQKLYNWLSNYSTEELNEFIELYKKDKKKKKKNIIMNNPNIAKHLEWYAERLIEN
jgi:DNA relaxase NicK